MQYMHYYENLMNLIQFALAESKAKLTTTRAAILQVVRHEGKISSAIGKEVGRSAVAIGSILGSMENDGLISRHRSAVDRRKVIVNSTAAGDEALGLFLGSLS